jgi:hypothetical protein
LLPFSVVNKLFTGANNGILGYSISGMPHTSCRGLSAGLEQAGGCCSLSGTGFPCTSKIYTVNIESILILIKTFY